MVNEHILSKEALKVAVVGVGYFGSHHARVLSSMPEVQLVGVVDSNTIRAQELATRFNTKAYGDIKEVIPFADALCIATNTESHYGIAIECIRHNRHVFIEKPVTSTLSEAIELKRGLSNRGLIVQVGHIERFNPVFKKATELLDTPLLFEAERLSPFFERSANIDVVKDLMIHDIDLILTILRTQGIDTEIEEIDADGMSLLTDKIDLAIARVRFSSGITAYLKVARVARDKKRQMTVYQKDGYLTLDLHAKEFVRFSCSDQSFIHEAVVDAEEPLYLELRSFVNSILQGTRPVVGLDDAIEALSVAETINSQIGVKGR